MWLQSEDCSHAINDFIELGGTWYPFCAECKMVVEVEPPDSTTSLGEIVRRIVKNITN